MFSPSSTAGKDMLTMGVGTKVPPAILAEIQEIAAPASRKVFQGSMVTTKLPEGKRRVFKPKGTSAAPEKLHEVLVDFATKTACVDKIPTAPADVYYDPRRMKDEDQLEADLADDPAFGSLGTAFQQQEDKEAQAKEAAAALEKLLRGDWAKARISKDRIMNLAAAASEREDLLDQFIVWIDQADAWTDRMGKAVPRGPRLTTELAELLALEKAIRKAVTGGGPEQPVVPPTKTKKTDVAALEKGVGDEVKGTLTKPDWAAAAKIPPLGGPKTPCGVEVEDGDVGSLKALMRKLKSWEAAKGDERAHDLFAYRQLIVETELMRLRQEYEGLVWKSVGSMSWSSDFDITLATPGGSHDTAVVRSFNSGIKRHFGVQPGTLFDTNLYVLDYADVAGKGKGELVDANVVQGAAKPKAITKMMQAGQDMGALMKQRRYMSAGDWGQYMLGILGDLERSTLAASGGRLEPDGRKRLDKLLAATRKQFEEADANYQISQARLMEKVAATRALDKGKALPKLQEQLRQVLAIAPGRGGEVGGLLRAAEEADGPAWKRLLGEVEALVVEVISSTDSDALGEPGREAFEALAEGLNHHGGEDDPDALLECSNELYLQGMDEVRKVEKRAAALLKEAEELEAKALTEPDVPSEDPDGGAIPVGEMMKARAFGLRQQADVALELARTKSAEAIYFAAEAYHTQGAVEHIVMGAQGSKLNDLEKSAAREAVVREESEADEAFRLRQDKAEKDAAAKKLRAALDKVDSWSVLQSFNENGGDFMKDMQHFGRAVAVVVDEEAPLIDAGKAFMKASKYLERMFDCVQLLKDKLGAEGKLPFEERFRSVGDLRKAIGEGVLLVRKGALQMVDDNDNPLPEEEAEAAQRAYSVAQMEAIFGTGSLTNLQSEITTITREVNAWVRLAIQEAETAASLYEERTYFREASKTA